MERDRRFEFDELVDTVRDAMTDEGRSATDDEIQAVIDAFQHVRAEHHDHQLSARRRGYPSWLEALPEIQAIVSDLQTAPEPMPPVTLRRESVQEIADAVAAGGRGGVATRGVHAGGAPHKLWPRAALAEATRRWVKGADGRSVRRTAEVVTIVVRQKVTTRDLTRHGWPPGKPFKFTREAMGLVVVAVEAGLLEWDDERGLGVQRQFSAGPAWLAIPRLKPPK